MRSRSLTRRSKITFITALLAVSLITWFAIAFMSLNESAINQESPQSKNVQPQLQEQEQQPEQQLLQLQLQQQQQQQLQLRQQQQQQQQQQRQQQPKTQPESVTNENVHVFYYSWYSNPKTDRKWSHWNHEIIPHWNEQTAKIYPRNVRYLPPHDIGSSFYPMRGPYSCRDRETLLSQFVEIRDSGIGVLVFSWWGQIGNENSADSQGDATDGDLPLVMEVAEEVGIKVAMHLEPYRSRTAASTKADVKYIIDKYGKSPAFYRTRNPMKPNDPTERPLFYVYDSYLVSSNDWATVLSPNGGDTIRGTPYDSLMIGLYVEYNDESKIASAHFDGIYTYFAATGFTAGSTLSKWPDLASWCRTNNKIFIPSVGPGYDDVRIRPWNGVNIRARQNGKYYDTMWQAAMDANAPIISITSYNEWMEGSQIEAAVPSSIANSIMSPRGGYKSGPYTYEDYSPNEPDFYMKRTKDWVDKLSRAPDS